MATDPQIRAQVGTFLSSVTVVLIICGGVGGLILSPIYTFEADIKRQIKDESDNVKEQIKEINLRMAPLLTLAAQVKSDDQNFARIDGILGEKTDKNVYSAGLLTIAKEMEDNKTSTLRAAEELNHQVHALEDKILSRTDVMQHLADISARVQNNETRINALNADIQNLGKEKAPVPQH